MKIHTTQNELILLVILSSSILCVKSSKVVKKSPCDSAEGCPRNFEVELRAVLANCKNQFAHQHTTIKPQDDEEDFEIPDTMHCFKKLHVTLKIHNEGKTLQGNQFVLIEHVIDSNSGEKVTLANPYIILLKQNPIYQLYGLRYRFMVNSEAKEEILNKMSDSYKGCDDYSQTPTCGNLQYSGAPLSYSQGFCCSCDDETNRKRQPRNRRSDNLTGPANIHDYIYQLSQNDDRSKRSTKSKKHNLWVKKKRKNVPKDLFTRSDFTGHRQLRGGQDCDDTLIPFEVDTKSYHESAHCLRFSDLWYSVYQLSNPLLEHRLSIRVFQKRDHGDGVFCWVDLTHGTMINIGTFHTKYVDKSIDVTASYDEEPYKERYEFDLNPSIHNILIPQTGKPNETNPEVAGGPEEYLVVDSADVKPRGDKCDSIGVGYIAFFNQKDRCEKPKGTCLRNQPRHLWLRDKKAAEEGRPGKYFLKKYAHVPEDALKYTKEGHIKYLALYYENTHLSEITLEIKADDNYVFSTINRAKITEVYVDSTSDVITTITVKIYNNGLTSAIFHPRIADCPLEIPTEWSNLEGKPTLIPPQKQNIFELKLMGALPIEEFACTVEALNTRSEILAVRRFLIIKNDRCICAWHCLCACLESTGLGCIPMLMESYKAAGFGGSMPLTTNMIQKSFLERTIFGFFYFSLLFLMIFLMLGVAKAFVGYVISTTIGVWGLDLLIPIERIPHYYEEELKHRTVVYDEQNWPVHPDTGKRSVRIVEDRVEVCLNVMFFFLFPVALSWWLLSKFSCAWCCREIVVNDQISDDGQECKKTCPSEMEKQNPERINETETEWDDEDCFDFIEESSGCKNYSNY